VRVLVVDDSLDIRILLRMMLRRDGRFDVIGEAADGVHGIELAAELQPDLVVLDRQMPVMGGIEAIPGIREAAPDAEVVLYTAGLDPHAEQLAVGAGAIGLICKQATTLDVGERLAELLAGQWDGATTEVEVRIGPLAAAAARAWIANTTDLLAAIRAHADVIWPMIGGPVAEDVLHRFDHLLAAWRQIASDTETFMWVGRVGVDDAERLVKEWARMDVIDDATLATFGCSRSGPEGAPFFSALSSAVVAALARHEQTRRLSETLHRDWVAHTA